MEYAFLYKINRPGPVIHKKIVGEAIPSIDDNSVISVPLVTGNSSSLNKA